MTGLIVFVFMWKIKGWLLLGLIVVIWWKFWRHELRPLWRSWRAAKRLQRASYEAEHELLRARADYEDYQWLHDNLYEGQYPADTLPLTNQMMAAKGYYPTTLPMAASIAEGMQDMNLDDYDDGLSWWRI